MKDKDRVDALLLMLHAPDVDIDSAERDVVDLGFDSAAGLAASRRICDALIPGYLLQPMHGSEDAQMKELSRRVTAVSAVLVLYPKCKFVVAAMWDKIFIQGFLGKVNDERLRGIVKTTLAIK
jgi:hypothetical protein